MRAVRTSLGLAVAVIAGVLVSAANGAAPPTKHHHHFHGVVIEIDHFKDKKGHGTIKIRARDHAKGATQSKGEHVVTVHVNQHTHFDKIIHSGKGNKAVTREVLAHFRDLEPGVHVRVKTDHGHHAHEVSILVHHKK
jgi:hypothetical protein